MKKGKLLINAFGLLSMIGMVVCFLIYLHIQPLLTPEMPIPTPEIQILGPITIPLIFLAGIYHIFLLLFALESFSNDINHIFAHSLYIALILLSGIFILSDVTLLSDIGKEYTLWDVSMEWQMLYGFTIFHIITMVIGFFLNRNRATFKFQKILGAINNGNDALFIAIHQIGLICGLSGVACVILVVYIPIAERFKSAWLMALSFIAVIPWAFIIIYWIIKSRKKPLAAWIDEKQFSDTAIGALIMGGAFMLLIGIFYILDITHTIIMPTSFWFSLMFFIYLLGFSAVIVIRNRV